eukprot:TRINITY_DN31890_c0_g1_i1.p1 TRINITY_DN31890_c0_g1~~TRINITY_DN31890_c0_g1_i1.p1  ORF type:complete len:400 (-),score=75.88 TRINITY_DN31890_c0_g1_i1:17-1216(-)
MLQMKELPGDLRQVVWKICIENPEEEQLYLKLYEQNRMTTVSQFDIQIQKDAENFVDKMTHPEEFDGSMILAMKILLSYYEKKMDRILADYLYMLSIPLIFTFGEQKHLHKKPAMLIGMFLNIHKIVLEFDPLTDLIVAHDAFYDALMTDLFMNSLGALDEDIMIKFTTLLDLERPTERTLLVLLVKKFVHSLGFNYLSLQITLFLWDQIFMKVNRVNKENKSQMEIFVAMVISLIPLKAQILECQTWDEFLELYYNESKNITFAEYYAKYCEIFENIDYYIPQYQIAKGIKIKGDLSVLENEAQYGKYSVSLLKKIKTPMKPKTKIMRPHFANQSQFGLPDESAYQINLQQNILNSQDAKEIQKNLYVDPMQKEEQFGMFPQNQVQEQQSTFDIMKGF